MLHFDGGSHLLDSCSSLPAFGRVVRHCPSRRQGRKFKPVIGHSHVSSYIGYPIATRAGEKIKNNKNRFQGNWFLYNLDQN